MNRNDKTSVWMIVNICVFFLLAIYLLAGTGTIASPILFTILIFFCVLMVFYLLMDSPPENKGDQSARKSLQQWLIPPFDVAHLNAMDIDTDDVFVQETRKRMGPAMIVGGRLRKDAQTAYRTLKTRFEGSGYIPALQEGENQEPILILAPNQQQMTSPLHARWHWNLFLLVLTLATTIWAGALHRGINLFENPGQYAAGLPYALGLLFILGAHEMGHYFATRMHGVRATLPFFIPVPFALGTFGAFIKIQSSPENRKALFDFSVAGPLAGLIIAIPTLFIGLRESSVLTAGDPNGLIGQGASVGSSFLFALIAIASIPEAIGMDHRLLLSPLAFSGWLGLLVTALNLFPIGQLDGGHIADAMFGQRQGRRISTLSLGVLFVLGLFVWSGLLFWAFLIFLVAGYKGPPPMNDLSYLDPGRRWLGWVSFILLGLILMPVPHTLYSSLGIHCPYV